MGRVLEQSSWQIAKPAVRPSLKGTIETDILIIGGGMAGINILYELVKAGKKVVLIEGDRIGSGATSFTTAFLDRAIDTDLTQLQKMFGTKSTQLISQAHQEAIERYEQIIKKEKIDCEFVRCSNYLYTTSKEDFEGYIEEAELYEQFGAKIKLQPTNDLPFGNYGYLEIKNQGKFHPLKYLYQLADICQKKGAVIYEQTKAIEMDVGDIVIIETEDGVIKAHQVIIATYAPFEESLSYKIRKGMYVDHVYEAQIPAGVLPEAIFNDSENPYHYFRVDRQGKHDRLIFGGETHREEIPTSEQKNYELLKKHFLSIMPELEIKLVRRWTGSLLEPSDGIAFIGRYPDKSNVYVATAFSGNGMTYSGIAAMIIRDLILGKKNEYAKVFAADRPLKIKALMEKGKDYIGTLVGGALNNSVESA